MQNIELMQGGKYGLNDNYYNHHIGSIMGGGVKKGKCAQWKNDPDTSKLTKKGGRVKRHCDQWVLPSVKRSVKKTGSGAPHHILSPQKLVMEIKKEKGLTLKEAWDYYKLTSQRIQRERAASTTKPKARQARLKLPAPQQARLKLPAPQAPRERRLVQFR
jgi:hypothetical protein